MHLRSHCRSAARVLLPSLIVVGIGVLAVADPERLREVPRVFAHDEIERSPAGDGVDTASMNPGDEASPARDCAGVFYPIQISVEPRTPALSGEVATAIVRVSTSQVMGNVRVRWTLDRALRAVTPPTESTIDHLAPGDVWTQEIAVELPVSLDRRTVEVTVEGWVHGEPLSRSTIWNLLPGGPEAAREVVRPDGSRVREVAARRIR